MPKNISLYRDSLSEEVLLSFLLPSCAADALAVGISENGRPMRDNLSVAYAASLFLTEVRGLPLEELTIESNERFHAFKKVGRLNRLGALLPKCRQLYSNRPAVIGNVEIPVSAYTVEDFVIRAVKCRDSDTFDADNLRSLLLLCGGECADAAVAFSKCKSHFAAKMVTATDRRDLKLYSALAVASMASRLGEENPYVHLNGAEIAFVRYDDTFLATDVSARAYVLFAPDFS